MSVNAERLPALLETAKEYAIIANENRWPPQEMILLPSESDPLLWNGLWFVHEGPYKGASLKFNIIFPSNYPERAPQIYFVTPIFHPLVHGNGLFTLPNSEGWKPRKSRLANLLQQMRRNFEVEALNSIKISDACNKEAFKIYQESKTSFNALASQASTLSQKPSALYDRDHWSLGGEFGPGLALEELNEKDYAALASRLGLKGLQLEK